MIDGFVNACAAGLGASGRALRKLQDGYLRSYLLGIRCRRRHRPRLPELPDRDLTMSFPILEVIVFLPLGAALVVALLPSTAASMLPSRSRVGAAVLEFGFAIWMVVAFKTGNAHAGFQFTSLRIVVQGRSNISWYLGVDGISLFLVAMTALLFPIAMASPPVDRSPRAYLGWMLLLEAACMATFLSLDAFLFFVAFELTLVPGYFVIVNGNGPRRGYAATKFFLYTFAGSAFLFVGILATYLLVAAHEPKGTIDYVQHRAAGPGRHAPADCRPGMAPGGVRHRVRGEDAAGPVPYVDAGRLHPGPHGRVDGAGRHPVQAGRLRHIALGDFPFPRRPPSAWPRSL